MARSVAAINAEIAALELQVVKLATTVSADGASVSYDLEGIRRRLDMLYIQRGRADGSDTMFARGRIRGLR